MKTTHRYYSEESGDFNRLCCFVIENIETIRTHSTFCLGRIVDWKYGLYEKKRSYAAFCNENAHLWFDAFGKLAGFAISEGGDAEFAIITLKGFRFLFEEMLQWVLNNWIDRGPFFATEITERQVLEAKILETYGFATKSTFITRRFDLTGELVPRFPIEPGFMIIDMHTHPDYRAQGILRANAFQGKSTITEEELLERIKYYNYANSGPIYHPQTDLCVVAPDGRFASGCEALIDAQNAEADIERVCTHSSFRKRGFARAVIQECLYRLREMGMRSAYITGYSPEAIALYGSLGAVDESRSLVYEISI